MTDCPEKLSIGVTLIVNLQVYLVAAAFKLPTLSQSSDSPNVMFGEGQETLDEK